MEVPNRELGQVVDFLERFEGMLFGPDMVGRIRAFLGVAVPFDGGTVEEVAAAFRELTRSSDAHVIEGGSVIAAVRPQRRSFSAADWQVGRAVSLAADSAETAGREMRIRFLVADAPAAYLPEGEVSVQRSEGRLLVGIPPLLQPPEAGARARLWPGVDGLILAPEERRLLRDRLASTPWVPERDPVSRRFLPAAIAPISPPGCGEGLAELYRTTLPVPAELLDSRRVGRQPVRFSLDWPYEETPRFEKNPTLLYRLPGLWRTEIECDAEGLEVESDSEGVATVPLPVPDLGAAGPLKVTGVAVRRSGVRDAWSPCRGSGEAADRAPVWSGGPPGDRLTIGNLEPGCAYVVEVVLAEPGIVPLLPRSSWRFGEEVATISVLHGPASFSGWPPVGTNGPEPSAVVSLRDLKRCLDEVRPFETSLALDPESVSAQRTLALTEAGLALTLNLTVAARAENRDPADLERCAVMIRALLDQLLPLPIPSIVTIEEAS